MNSKNVTKKDGIASKKMRIIVTGAAGFIGDRIIDQLLSQNHDPVAMLHAPRDRAHINGQVESFVADITDPESLRGRFHRCDTVIHLAGSTIARSAAEFHRINHEGTKNVATACLAVESPPKLLYVSSLASGGPASLASGSPASVAAGSPASVASGGPASVATGGPRSLADVGRHGSHPPIASDQGTSIDRSKLPFRARIETDVPDPVSDYGRSKLAAEKTLASLAGQMAIQVVRPPSVFGETDRYMRSFFQAAAAGWVIVPKDPNLRYSMIHVDDLCGAMIHLIQRDDFCLAPVPKPNQRDAAKYWSAAGLAYLAHDNALTFPQLAQIIANHVGRQRVRTIAIPAWVTRSIATANSIAMSASSKLGFNYRPLLNRDKMREALAGSWACDASRLTDQLGFAFPETLDQRIRQTIDGYRNQK